MYLAPIEECEALAHRVVEVFNLYDLQWRAVSYARLTTATHYRWDDAANLPETHLHDLICKIAAG